MSTFGHSINGILISPMPATTSHRHHHQSLSAIAVPLPRPRSPASGGGSLTSKPFTSFFIRDILGSKLGGLQPITLSATHHHHHHIRQHDVLSSLTNGGTERSISTTLTTRSVTNNFSPWSPRPTPVRSPPITKTPPTTPASNNIRTGAFVVASAKQPKKTLGSKQQQQGGSPLSALEELANKTFTGLETSILRAAEGKEITIRCKLRRWLKLYVQITFWILPYHFRSEESLAFILLTTRPKRCFVRTMSK